MYFNNTPIYSNFGPQARLAVFKNETTQVQTVVYNDGSVLVMGDYKLNPTNGLYRRSATTEEKELALKEASKWKSEEEREKAEIEEILRLQEEGSTWDSIF